MGNAKALEIRGLSKSLGKRRVLTDIDLDVGFGEVFGFLGPNGSGKTTTIKLMLGLLNYDTGSISICGHDVKRDFEKAAGSVGGIIENPEMYKYLTGRENLKQYARMSDGVPKGRIDEVTETVGLTGRIDEKVSKYSLGMRQRLGLAQAILCKPRFLVLDEPTNGLDPEGIKDLRDILKRLAHEEGCGVFISSHMLAELDQLCDRVCVINNGRVIKSMTMEEIRGMSQTGIIAYEVECSDKAAAIEAAVSMNMKFSREGNKLVVYTEKENIHLYISELAGRGIEIEGITPMKNTLEDVFLRLVKEDERSRSTDGR